MPVPDPLFLTGGNFIIGLLLGCLLFRSDFCMAAMLRDFFLFRDVSLLRAFLFYLILSAPLFLLAAAAASPSPFPPHTLGPAAMTTLAGGILFGLGMVLAGGCVIGTIYRMAAGNLTYWIGFSGILLGSMIYAETHPQVQEIAVKTRITDTVVLFQDREETRIILILLLSILGGAALVSPAGRTLFRTTGFALGYIRPWKAVLALALLNASYYLFSGSPMGVTTAYAKLAGYLENLVAPHHVAGLEYFQSSSISWQMGDILMEGGAGPRVDFISYTELPLVIGTFTGSLLTALYYREFRIYGLPPLRQGVAALLGGILLAMGARIASGCNVKFFLGAMPLLAYQGIFFFIAAAAGAFLGTRILTRFVIR
ncbi:MAG: YeeE/YedE family protein [Desulfobulbaceae bacterium]